MNTNEIELAKEILKKNSQKNGDCIEWTGKLNQGYGSIYFNKNIWTAYRLAFYVYNGEIPENKIICHRCNNKKCINPCHLYVGTYVENSRDFRNFQDYQKMMDKRKKNKEAKIKGKPKLKKERDKEFLNHLILYGYLTVNEFAILLNIHRNTVLNMIKTTRISAIKLSFTRKSPFRIPVSEIHRIAEVDLQGTIKELMEKKVNITHTNNGC